MKPRKRRSNLTDAQFLKLTPRQLSQLTRRLRKSPPVPEPPALKATYNRIMSKRRRPGRPKIGAGYKPVLISMEKSFLSQVDRFAKARKISRSQLITEALRDVISKAGYPECGRIIEARRQGEPKLASVR